MTRALKPGTLLRIYQHIKRVRGTMDGIQVTASAEYVRIETPDMIACYDYVEAEQLAQLAATWPRGVAIETLLP